MRFSEHWLRTWVNPELATEALGTLLTMAGLEVEDIAPVAPPFSGVIVGEIKEVVKHDNADRLRVTQVEIAKGECIQVVCGAANAVPGIKVPCALPGAILPHEVHIKTTKVRGVLSQGMLCSGKELGIPDDTDGLLVLPELSEVGQTLRQLFALDDQIFTVKITPNRADCLSIRGIAREVAALLPCPWTPIEPVAVTAHHADSLPIKNDAGAACGRYINRMIRNVNAAAPTPAWMKLRLERSGIRPISAIVDVTNYVLLEQGQPLHAFDLSAVQGGITVRMARPGETLYALNEKTISLDPSMLVIADEQKILALAGVIGGFDSRVTSKSQDILLESAFFAPEAIAGKSRQLGFGSESSYRYERGVDFQRQREAIERATQLILEICGGKAGPVVEQVNALPERQAILLRAARVRQILGVDFTLTEIGDALRRLHLSVEQQGETLRVIPPSFRFDLRIEEDLIEELARLRGYAALPAKKTPTTLRMLPVPAQPNTQATLRRKMVARAYQEVITYAFVSSEAEQRFAGNDHPIKLINPIAAPLNVMRSSLLASLVDVLVVNINRKQTRVRIFEVARTFHAQEKGYDQPERLAALAWGLCVPEQWGATAARVDFYDIKADLEYLLSPQCAEFQRATHPAFHPGRCAQIVLNGKAIGFLGELHPQWVQHYDLTTPPVLFEVDVAALQAPPCVLAEEVSKQPMVRRDLALVVEEELEAGTITRTLRAVEAPFVVDIALFDVYRGSGVAPGKKSLAFRIMLQSSKSTLTDEQVDASVQQLLDAAQFSHGATRRGN